MAQNSNEIIEVDVENEDISVIDPEPRRDPLQIHQENVNGKDAVRERVQCQYCWKLFSITHLQDHIQRVHSTRAKEKCPFCSFESFDLRKHIHRKHPDKKEMTGPCCYCNKYFNCTYSLERHYKVVHKVTNFQITNQGIYHQHQLPNLRDVPTFWRPQLHSYRAELPKILNVQSIKPGNGNFKYILPKESKPFTEFLPVKIVKKNMPPLLPIANNENVTVIHIGGAPTPNQAGPSKRPKQNIEIIELDSPPKEDSNSFSDENPLVIDLDIPEEVNLESSEEDIDETEFNELIDYFKN